MFSVCIAICLCPRKEPPQFWFSNNGLKKNILLNESNTVVSAYTLYRHLQQYCSHPSNYDQQNVCTSAFMPPMGDSTIATVSKIDSEVTTKLAKTSGLTIIRDMRSKEKHLIISRMHGLSAVEHMNE